MEAGSDTVYFDTGDVLVTSRRAAFQSVSVPLAGVSSARVEQQERLRPVHRWKPGAKDIFLILTWLVFVVVLISFAISLMAVGAMAPPWLEYRIYAALLAMLILSSVLASRRRHVLVATPVWAVLLKIERKEVELFRTRHRRQAVRVAEAINRAVAAARG